MGYRIDYGPSLPRRREETFPVRLVALTCGFFIVFLMGVKLLWPEGSEELARLLLPVHSDRSMETVEAFISDLKAGAPFYESLTAFCRQIIAHADIPAA